jgi:hypothetical protein
MFAILLACAGCANNSVVNKDYGNPGVLRIETHVEYVDTDNRHLEKEQFPKDVVLAFPYIAGGIFGRADSEPLFVERVTEELGFSLELADKQSIIENASRPLMGKWLELGLNITPAETRLSRIGTFSFNGITDKHIGGGGFINSLSRNSVILIYVDRACEIKGEIKVGKKLYIHQIELPAKGYFWIEIEKTSEATSILSAHPNNGDVHFSIKIFDLLAV